MLQKLILNDTLCAHQVVSLTSTGRIGENLKAHNIKVTPLGLNFFNFLFVFLKLYLLLHKIKPDVVQTWMYHSDFFGGIAAKFAGIDRIFWNIRNTEIPQKKVSLTGGIIKICSILSYIIPNKIICCANAAMLRHIELGYCRKKMIIIPNGYEINRSSNNTASQFLLKSYLNIKYDDLVIGVVGRFDYLKGYDVFIDAASLITQYTNKNIIFLCVGRNVDLNNQALVSQIRVLKMENKFRLIGEVNNVDEFFSIMDIFCLPSRAEGFPNVVAEAMLASLPCVVTDVGDAAIIVGEHGFVVPPGNHLALSIGINNFLNMNYFIRKSIGAHGRNKIIENYDLNIIVKKYFNVYAGE